MFKPNCQIAVNKDGNEIEMTLENGESLILLQDMATGLVQVTYAAQRNSSFTVEASRADTIFSFLNDLAGA